MLKAVGGIVRATLQGGRPWADGTGLGRGWLVLGGESPPRGRPAIWCRSGRIARRHVGRSEAARAGGHAPAACRLGLVVREAAMRSSRTDAGSSSGFCGSTRPSGDVVFWLV